MIYHTEVVAAELVIEERPESKLSVVAGLAHERKTLLRHGGHHGLPKEDRHMTKDVVISEVGVDDPQGFLFVELSAEDHLLVLLSTTKLFNHLVQNGFGELLVIIRVHHLEAEDYLLRTFFIRVIEFGVVDFLFVETFPESFHFFFFIRRSDRSQITHRILGDFLLFYLLVNLLFLLERTLAREIILSKVVAKRNIFAPETGGILLGFVQSAADSDDFARVNAGDFRLSNVCGKIVLELPALFQYFDELVKQLCCLRVVPDKKRSRKLPECLRLLLVVFDHEKGLLARKLEIPQKVILQILESRFALKV